MVNICSYGLITLTVSDPVIHELVHMEIQDYVYIKHRNIYIKHRNMDLFEMCNSVVTDRFYLLNIRRGIKAK